MTTADSIWPVEDKYLDGYERHVAVGRDVALRTKVVFLAIARDAMPHLTNTLALVEESAAMFREAVFYVFENDSTDGTDAVLKEFAASRPWVTTEHATLDRPDVRGFEPERTVRLAEYRNRCRDWAIKNHPDADYVIVLDLDPHGGFSTAGILNSIGLLCELRSSTLQPALAGAMASMSLFVSKGRDGSPGVAQYDAWAARMNFWEDRRGGPGGMAWFHMLLLPIGSPPVPMNSAFGGLCVYAADAFYALGVRYEGSDCEHVLLHKNMRAAGYQLYLNPGSRYIAILP
jgi:hypothetical protein